MASVAVLFGVSGGSLWLAGYNYDSLTGSPLTKIHPFTYMVIATFLARTFAFGSPVGYLVHVVSRRPAALLMAAVGAVLFAVTILRQAPGMAGMVDTYIGPALLAMLLADADERTTARMTTLLHVLMTANAFLALFEFATKIPVFPYRFDGEVFPTDGRSSGLQGHPLTNALVTACYILALLNGRRTLPPAVKLSLILLQGTALVVFGGRSGMVVSVLLGGLYGIFAALKSLRGGRVSLPAAATGMILLGILPVVVMSAAQAGFFDAILGRFVSDGGSANARVEMFDIFGSIPLRELIVGPDLGLVETLRRANGLELGIENPIVRMMLYQGAFLTLVTMIAVGLFMRDLTQDCEPGAWLPMLAFLILLNTSESIAVKTTVLAKFAVIVTCFYRRPSARVAAPFSRAAWSGPARRGSLDRGRA